MRPGGGQRFLPANAPQGARGLGSFAGPTAAPAVMPATQAVPRPVSISAEDLTQWRNILEEKGYIPAKAVDAYFTRLPPETIQQLYRTYFTETASTPGVFRQARLGGFQVPQNMIAVLFSMEFRASFLSGGIEVPVPPGVLGRNLSFAAFDNAQQLGLFGGANVAPAGGFVYGEYAPDQQPPQVPAAIQVIGTGPGMLPAPNQCFYVQSGHQVAFTMTTLAATPIAIQSGEVTVAGIFVPVRDLFERIGSGL